MQKPPLWCLEACRDFKTVIFHANQPAASSGTLHLLLLSVPAIVRASCITTCKAPSGSKGGIRTKKEKEGRTKRTELPTRVFCHLSSFSSFSLDLSCSKSLSNGCQTQSDTGTRPDGHPTGLSIFQVLPSQDSTLASFVALFLAKSAERAERAEQ